MTYSIQILNKARKQIKALPKDIQAQVRAAIKALAHEPRPSRVKKLSGSKNLYRIRIRQYRVIYEIKDDVLLIVVVIVGHRREIYGKL